MTVIPVKTTGERIKYQRTKRHSEKNPKRKLGQEEFAEMIGCNKGTVVDWEKDTVVPETENLLKLSEFFNVSVDYLLCRIEEKNHDLQFIRDLTGLSEEAILKIISLRKKRNVLNYILVSKHFEKIIDLISYSAKYADKRGNITIANIKSKLSGDKNITAALEPLVKACGGDLDLIYRANTSSEATDLFDEVSSKLYEMNG